MSAPRLYKRRGEEGFALPMALAFLIVCTLVTAVILQFTSTAEIMSSRLGAQRSDLYAASGAIDAAIKLAQADGTLTIGSESSNPCQAGSTTPLLTTTANGKPVTVNCDASGDSGAGGTTLAPNFAILTLAPYKGLSPTSGCNNTYDELGIVQVQNSKLVQVNGNVYVNSDADSDIWSGGCPQLSTATHIQVANGEVLQRASEHDITACPNLHNHVTDCGLANNDTGLPTLNAADQAALTDPRLGADSAEWTANISAPPAAGTIHDASGNVISSCPPVDPSSGYRVVQFWPGTFSDVTPFNNLMGGGCPDAVFWFKPGNYYFNFTNSGSHEWTIADTSTRVIGGQYFAGPDDPAMFTQNTWKSLNTVTAAQSGSGTLGFGTPNNAQKIDGMATTATLANGGTASITLSGFANSAGTAIPPDAQIDAVRLRVAHGSANAALLKAPTVTITPAVGPACTVQAITPKTGAPTEDAAPNYSVFTISGSPCLNDVSKINGTTKLTYSVSHCAPVTGACTSAATTDSVDGIWLDVSYTTGGRLSWSPFNAASITPSAPTVPGGCLSDRDSKKYGWNDGVQFVFGGDSRINLKSGKVELCDKPSNTKQEIVVYGVPAATSTAVDSTWLPTTVGANSGFTLQDNGRIADNQAATALLNSNGARTLTVTQLAPTNPPTWPIAPGNQIPTGSVINSVTLRVAHGEGVTTSGRNPTSGNVNTPTVTITPAGGGANCGTMNLTKRNGIGTDQITGLATTCLDTAEKINGGIGVTFSVSRAASATVNEALDGFSLAVNYTPPASSSGSLNPSSGCTAQAPYYNPPGASPGPDHSPGFNGACARLRVSTDSAGGSFPRVLTLWGTVYTPSDALDVPVDVMTVPVFNRGVVARMLMLGYNVANSAIVPITTTPAAGVVRVNRVMTLTATIPGTTTSVTAVVRLCDALNSDDGCTSTGTPGDPPAHVLSWKVTR